MESAQDRNALQLEITRSLSMTGTHDRALVTLSASPEPKEN